MKEEIDAAVQFLSRLLERGNRLEKVKVAEFSQKIKDVLLERFENHWYPNEPTKGQAYRCIRVNEFGPVDGVLERAARECGLVYHDLGLPQELTLWVDPHDVSCRFGEAKGSFCTVARFHGDSRENHALTLDIGQLLQRHHDLKKIEMKQIMYGHNRSTLQTYPLQPRRHSETSSQHAQKQVDTNKNDHNMNMSNWSNVSSHSWRAKSLNGHLTSKKSRFSWLAAEMVVA